MARFFNQLQAQKCKTSAIDVRQFSRLLCPKKKVNAYILIRHQRGSKDHSNVRYTHLIHGVKSYHSEKEIRLTVNTLL